MIGEPGEVVVLDHRHVTSGDDEEIGACCFERGEDAAEGALVGDRVDDFAGEA